MAFRLSSHQEIYDELTGFVTEYNELKNDFDEIEEPTVEETRFRLSLVLELMVKIKERYYHLRAFTLNLQVFEEYYSSVMKTYIPFVGRMRSIVGPDHEGPMHSTRFEDTFRSPKVKFPVIKLPEFNGALENWIEFRDKFESLVNSNRQLSNIEKFHYLHSAIQLPAGQQNVLQNFALSEVAYEDAWKSVQDRYDDKRKLKSQQFNTLLTVKKMTSESPAELRRILDSFSASFTALKLLGSTEDDFRVHIVQYRLDEQTLKDWQKNLDDEDPTWERMREFLTKQWRSLDSMPHAHKNPISQKLNAKPSSSSKTFTASTSASPSSCTKCGEAHRLHQCPQFQSMSVHDRFNYTTEKRLCRNCLSPAHVQRNCVSQNRCRVCKKNHHSMLHFESAATSSATSQPHTNPGTPPFQPKIPPRINYLQSQSNSNSSTTFHSTVKSFTSKTEALLSTVSFFVLDASGSWRTCRALLDSGSQSNYVTTSFAVDLGIALMPACIPVVGINGQASVIKKKTKVFLSSKYTDFNGSIECSVTDDITGFLPNRLVDISRFKIPVDLFLADPNFHIPGRVDMLLGTGMFHKSILANMIEQPGLPHLVETRFGWTVGGEFPISSSSTFVSCFAQVAESGIEELDKKLDKFIEMENFGTSKRILSPEEDYCQKRFECSTKRLSNGRIIVELPLNNLIERLGLNFSNSVRQFYYLEKKRLENEVLNRLYVDYMEEFISSGHMTEISSGKNSSGYILPHHGVLRVGSSTTKLRPVFNGSSKSETGVTLNECLCVGPMVQSESFDILLRFRERLFVLKADIEKMYRQVFVEPSQRKYQQIVWRSSPNEVLRHYELNTVTFGLSSAPFLATRALQFIADENLDFPEAANAIKTSFYVDDLLISFDTIAEGIKLRDDIIHILASAMMPLRKWSSNHQDLLSDLPEKDKDSVDKNSPIIKTLGLVWNSIDDKISFSIKPASEGPITKASVLSEIASIYDPIGLIGPVILRAKLYMKPLHSLKWTQELSEDDKNNWVEFRSRLSCLNNLKIDRHAILMNPVSIELHGFCDASKEAYGAVIYLRSCDAVGNIKISPICSKSRVSPLKQKTIARLELCGAVLLSKLMSRIVEILSVDITSVTMWSDSMITLFWISKEPSRMSVFVGNRVSVIQENSTGAVWKHIGGKETPGDTISRGLYPEEIADCKLWWNGPAFLHSHISKWPESLLTINDDDSEVVQEMRKSYFVSLDSSLFTLIETRFSKIQKIINCFGYIRRLASRSSLRKKGPLSIIELEKATLDIIRILQKTLFPAEYKFFIRQTNNPSLKEDFPSKSSIICFFPFMDDKKVIRVGGRLHASPGLTEDQKHQIILPHSHFAKLIVRDIHKKNLHPGPTATLSFVREYYWIIGAKSLIRQIQRECLLCFRVKPILATQLMGNLPLDRVRMSPPFSATALDYAGHFNLRSSLTKKASIIKGYIAMFKCMSTGAIHLEAVTSLSTTAFITVFDRFISRRGLPNDIYSDNGTEFVGADNEFKKILKEIEPDISEHLREKRINWHFTTPVAPHAGGYYESGIKTMKHHLKRECADRSFDFEQFSTLLCKIEAVINSRPLMPISEDPTDLQVLTPAHFLIGRSLIAKPERNFIPVNVGRLDRFNQLQQVQQKFWASWYHDYLHHLQSRPNNFRKVNEFTIGDMVLIRDQNLPPLKWLIGRIIKTFPDKTNVVRRVRVRTSSSEKDRHVKYLCLLPFEKTS